MPRGSGKASGMAQATETRAPEASLFLSVSTKISGGMGNEGAVPRDVCRNGRSAQRPGHGAPEAFLFPSISTIIYAECPEGEEKRAEKHRPAVTSTPKRLILSAFGTNHYSECPEREEE